MDVQTKTIIDKLIDRHRGIDIVSHIVTYIDI